MQSIQKKIQSYLHTAMGYAVFFIILGIILLLFPELSLDIIRWSLVVIFMFFGAWRIVGDMRLGPGTGTLSGILMFVLGLIIAVHPNVLNVIPIILGIWMIISGTYSLRLTVGLRGQSGASYFISLFTSVVSILAGITLIVNPYSSIALTAFIGIMVIIYAAASLIDLIVLNTRIKEVAKYVNGHKIIEVKVKKK